MKTKEKQNKMKVKKMEAMVDAFDELTEDELAQVIGGLGGDQSGDDALLTFNGKFLNNGARTCKGTTAARVMFTEQMSASTSAASTLTSLMTRNGASLNIEATDQITMS